MFAVIIVNEGLNICRLHETTPLIKK
jgi:hypothetical protein